MTIARKFAVTAIAATLALGVAAPAVAWDQSSRGLRAEIAQLDRQINRAEERGVISRREANRLERQVERLQDTYQRFARGGFNRHETRTLSRQIAEVRQQIGYEARDHNRRADAGRYDRYEDGRRR